MPVIPTALTNIRLSRDVIRLPYCGSSENSMQNVCVHEIRKWFYNDFKNNNNNNIAAYIALLE